MTNDVSKQIVNWDDSKYLEQRITELEFRNRELTDELTALKAELAERKQSVRLPEDGQSFSYLDSLGSPQKKIFTDTMNDNLLQKNNNVFKYDPSTCNHLVWYHDNVIKVQNRLMQLHELLCSDYFPDWDDSGRRKFDVYYDAKDKFWNFSYVHFMNLSVVYFTESAAKKACEILNAEKFMMGDDA